MPRLHLGINTCFAVKRWPEPERWLSIVKEDLGLDCCQFSLDLVDPLLDEIATAGYAAATRAIAAEKGVLLHSTFTGLAAYSWSLLLHPEQAMRTAALHWYTRAIDFSAQLGASGTGGHLGALSVQDAAHETRRQALLQELSEHLETLAHYAARQGLDFLLFENMAVTREWGHSIEEARTLDTIDIKGNVPITLCLDVGHPCALHTGTSSDDYHTWLTQPWRHTPVVHLQQTDRTGDHHWPFTAEYNHKGMVQAQPIVQAIRQWSEAHDVYLFLEAIHPFEADDDTVLHDLQESVAYWREALQFER